MEHGGCLFEPDMLPVALMGELSIGAPTRILIEFNENMNNLLPSKYKCHVKFDLKVFKFFFKSLL